MKMKRVNKTLRLLLKDWYIVKYGYYENEVIAKYIESFVKINFGFSFEMRETKEGIRHAFCVDMRNNEELFEEIFVN